MARRHEQKPVIAAAAAVRSEIEPAQLAEVGRVAHDDVQSVQASGTRTRRVGLASGVQMDPR